MIQPIGYLKLWRELFTKPIWLNSTKEQQIILITLLAMANFNSNQWEWNGKKFQAQPGQFVTSASSIIANTGNTVTRQNVRTALARFEKLDFLTYESTKTGLLITIVNWGIYQGNGDSANHDTNQDLTKTQPRPNQDLTTIEEGKKVEKVKRKEKTYSDYEPLDIAIKDFIEMRSKIKKPMTDRAIQITLSRLNKLTGDKDTQVNILEQSILNNWQGVFELKEKPVEKKKVVSDEMPICNLYSIN